VTRGSATGSSLFLTCAAGTLIVGYVAVAYAGPLALAMLGLGALALSVVLAPSPRVPLTLAILLFFASETDAARESALLSASSKGAALAFVALIAVRFARDGRPAPMFTGVVALSIGAYAWAGTAGYSAAWPVDTLGIILALATLRLVMLRVTALDIGIALDWALVAALLGSLALVAPGWFGPVQGGRLQGFFANANTLGFIAAVAFLRATLHHHGARMWAYGTLAVVVLVWTGSRAPVLAASLALILALIQTLLSRREGTGRVLVIATAAAVVGGLVINGVVGSGLAVLRTDDTRAIGTSYALESVAAHPAFGIGYGQSEIEVASTPLRWMGEMGWLGLVFVVAIQAWLVFSSWRMPWRTFMVVLFGVVHSWFEGWFLAGGSSLYFVFWLLVFSGLTPSGRLRPREAHAATHPHSGPAGSGRRRSPGGLPAPGHRHQRLGDSRRRPSARLH
jgi:hypothetical protein